MDGSKSPYVEVDLMTGVRSGDVVHKSLLVREMAGPEEDILASRKMSVSRKMTTIMANCIMKFGSVEDRSEINKMVDNMVISDRIYFLMKLRAISLGESYTFTSACPECGKEDKKIFNLNDIKVTRHPEADKLFKEIKLPSGNVVRLKVGNGLTEEYIEKTANDQNAATIALFSRVDQLNDERPALVDVKKLSLKDRQEIRKAIEEMEGDIDDEFLAVCPSCGHEYKGEVPLNGADFFFP